MKSRQPRQARTTRVGHGERRFAALSAAKPSRAKTALRHASTFVSKRWLAANQEAYAEGSEPQGRTFLFLEALSVAIEEVFEHRAELAAFAKRHSVACDLHVLLLERVSGYMRNPRILRARVYPSPRVSDLRALVRLLRDCLGMTDARRLELAPSRESEQTENDEETDTVERNEQYTEERNEY